MADPLWIDADAGAPAYTAAELRQAMALALMYDGRAMGARQGVRPGGDQLAVSLDGATITVAPGVCCVDPGLSTPQGPYWVAIPTAEHHELDPAHATNPRKDIVVVRVYDDSEDSSGLRLARSEYIPGTPDPSPSEPATPTGAIRIATIDVPASGGGAPAVTDRRPYTVAAGGILPVASDAELAAGVAGRYRHRLDTGQLEWDTGAGWRTVGGRPDLAAYKTSTTIRSSTTTPTDDPDLTVVGVAGAVYAGRMTLYISSASANAGDLSFRFTQPGSGARLSFGVNGLSTALTGGTTGELTALMVESSAATTAAISIGASSTFTVAQIDIAWSVGATPGPLTLQWAQASSHTSATSVRSLSNLMLWRLN